MMGDVQTVVDNIMGFIDKNVEDLSRSMYLEVLQYLQSNIEVLIDAAHEDDANS